MGYAMMIGEELGLGYEDVEQLRFAGLLHDIGKTGLPGEILLKPSRLSAEELAKVHSHAEIGASIVDQIEFLKSLTPVILHHHEHWDGSGYPLGLSGEDIPLMARILCVADSFDAMTTKSSYKKRMTVCDRTPRARGQRRHPVRPAGRRGPARGARQAGARRCHGAAGCGRGRSSRRTCRRERRTRGRSC